MSHSETIDGAPVLPAEAFAMLGGNQVAYLRPLKSENAKAIFPQAPDLQPGLDLWALLAANGQPIMLTDSKAAAIANAHEHDLQAVSVH